MVEPENKKQPAKPDAESWDEIDFESDMPIDVPACDLSGEGSCEACQ